MLLYGVFKEFNFLRKKMIVKKLIFNLIVLMVIASIQIEIVKLDTPANCTYEDIRGVWVFHEGSRLNDKNVNCSAKGLTN